MITMDVTNASSNHSLLARTNKCGWVLENRPDNWFACPLERQEDAWSIAWLWHHSQLSPTGSMKLQGSILTSASYAELEM